MTTATIENGVTARLRCGEANAAHFLFLLETYKAIFITLLIEQYHFLLNQKHLHVL